MFDKEYIMQMNAYNIMYDNVCDADNIFTSYIVKSLKRCTPINWVVFQKLSLLFPTCLAFKSTLLSFHLHQLYKWNIGTLATSIIGCIVAITRHYCKLKYTMQWLHEAVQPMNCMNVSVLVSAHHLKSYPHIYIVKFTHTSNQH